MAAMRRWWLNHPLSPDEIREIASMIRPHDRPPRPKTSPAVLALTASGDPSDDGGKADLEVSVEVARARRARQNAVEGRTGVTRSHNPR